jgi:hypothetical protein
MSEAIVTRALVGVGEDGIRFGAFLERLFGRLVAWIAIRMVLQRQLAVSALDFLFARVAADAKHGIVIALAHDAFATRTRAGRNSRSPSR